MSLFEVEADARMFAVEDREQIGYLTGTHRQGKPEPDPAVFGIGRLGEIDQCRIDLPQRGTHRAHEIDGRRRQTDGATARDGQCHAEVALECVDPSTHRGLGYAEGGRRLGQVTVLISQFDEFPQRRQRRRPSIG